MKCYVIKDKSGKFVDLDADSGGYPVLVNEWHQGRLWTDEQRARNYMNMFTQEGSSYSYKWSLVLVEPSFVTI